MLDRILFSEATIAERIKRLSEDISKDYRDKNPLFIGVLTGAFIFYADLIRQFDFDCSADFIAVESYGASTTSSGNVKLRLETKTPLSGRDIIIVEDILDTGYTLQRVINLLIEQNPASIKICVLLDKAERRKVPIYADFVGFTIPDEFVVGYGLDFNEHWRNLPYISTVVEG
jgi:hypoxanthine phosphoribosyltransferase